MIYFTVGPTQLYKGVEKWVQQAFAEDVPSVSHRGTFFHELYQRVDRNLKQLLSIPSDYEIFFLSSGTEGWERVIQNCVEKQSFHFVNGVFSERFFTIARDLNKEAVKTEVPYGQGFDVKTVSIPQGTELIGLTQCDTSTGAWFPEEDIAYLRKNNPNCLIAIDAVSSLPYAPFNFANVDYTLFSVQKGFGLPAGLGLLIVSPRALQRSEGSYHSFKNLLKYKQKWETPETPNVLTIYLLDKVVENMLEKGIDTIRKETDEKYELFSKYFGTLKNYAFFMQEERFRSRTVMVIETKGKTKEIIEKLKKRGFTIGTGYGEYANTHIRIANFPAHSAEKVDKIISFLDEI